MVSVDDLIFQTHTRAGPLSRVSGWDITGIVGAGFYKYYRYYQGEDAGTGKESRLSWFLNHTSTLVHGNTLYVFFGGLSVRVQSPGNTHRIFFTSYYLLLRWERDKK